MQSDRTRILAFLKRFAKMPAVDQRAIAQHLSRDDQRRLANWLEENAPSARRERAYILRQRLSQNGSAIRSQTLRAILQGKLTAATRAALEAHLAQRSVRPAPGGADATTRMRQALP